jgi:hypothetical protein
MISSIISKEFYNIGSSINILWTPADSIDFKQFFNLCCSPCSIIDFDKTYHGIYDIHIVVCNNRIAYFDKCIELCKFFHCPMLIIDHGPKPNMVSGRLETSIPIKPIYQVAIAKEIYSSWDRVHDCIIEYSIHDPKTYEPWKNLIFQLCKSNMIVKEEEIQYEQNTQQDIIK